MNHERIITVPGKSEHSGVLLANAMASVGFNIKVSDSFEIIGSKKTQDVFFGLSDTPEMTMVFWAIHGESAKYLETSKFISEARFSPDLKKKLIALALLRVKGSLTKNPESPLEQEDLDDLQKLVYGFVKQKLKKRTS